MADPDPAPSDPSPDTDPDPDRPVALPAPGDVRAALVEAARAELGEQGAGGISLRAVARRAGVSHAAPKHHFGDRAGLLTTLAADGHRRLADALRRTRDTVAGGAPDDGAHGPTGGEVVAALGRAYLDFGLENPALHELMFRTDQLHPRDPALVAAREDALGVLVGAVGRAGVRDGFGGGEPADRLALVAWGLVHGLVVLVREGALDEVAPDAPDGASRDDGGADLARSLLSTFTRALGAADGPRPRTDGPVPPLA